jgi:hypothetical protein
MGYVLLGSVLLLARVGSADGHNRQSGDKERSSERF